MRKVMGQMLLSGLVLLGSFWGEMSMAQTKLYDFEVNKITGEKSSLKEFNGKVALVVNVASKCGFTSQYEGLQKIYEKYKDKGFVVLGFPSNDFGSQEPGSNKEIKTFCETNFNVNFPMFEKGVVKGPEKQPIYRFLTDQSEEKFRGEIKWNFEKFLVNKEGKVIGRYRSITSPESRSLASEIEKALK